MIVQSGRVGGSNRREETNHAGAPRDIGHQAPDSDCRMNRTAAAAGRSSGEVLRAIGRRLFTPFRGDEHSVVVSTRQQRPRRSKWWFLLPIFLHSVGGIVAFFVLRDDDDSTARNCLYLGLSLTALTIGPFILLAAMAGSGAAD